MYVFLNKIGNLLGKSSEISKNTVPQVLRTIFSKTLYFLLSFKNLRLQDIQVNVMKNILLQQFNPLIVFINSAKGDSIIQIYCDVSRSFVSRFINGKLILLVEWLLGIIIPTSFFLFTLIIFTSCLDCFHITYFCMHVHVSAVLPAEIISI